jgi:hypothetical protein
MQIIPTNSTVSDYCEAMIRKEIIVNHRYQRSDKVWPPAAKSFLIETILLNYSVPKLSLYQVVDVKSRKTIKEIIDGQQRSSTILEFYRDEIRISKSSELIEAAGKTYSQLDEDLQQKFLSYSLSIDLFVQAVPEQIREVFRRINSYTVPLSPEEKRHSIYQGEFKWFIYRLSKKHDTNLSNMGVFTEKQLVRMVDAKLLTEITYAIINGITTTTAKNLDAIYKNFDSDFAQASEIEERFDKAMDVLISLDEIHKTPLVKPHLIYALILAISHFFSPIETLQPVYQFPMDSKLDRNFVLPNLTALADALENQELFEAKFEPFVNASLKTTNEKKRRQEIFRWMCKALLPKLL